MIHRDLIYNVLNGNLDFYSKRLNAILIKDAILSDQSKKEFLSDYAKSIGEEYNDFNFSIIIIEYNFNSRIMEIQFVLGSNTLDHTMMI